MFDLNEAADRLNELTFEYQEKRDAENAIIRISNAKLENLDLLSPAVKKSGTALLEEYNTEVERIEEIKTAEAKRHEELWKKHRERFSNEKLDDHIKNKKEEFK